MQCKLFFLEGELKELEGVGQEDLAVVLPQGRAPVAFDNSKADTPG